MEEVAVERTTYSLSPDAPALPERRSGERHLTLYRVGVLLFDGRRELCLVKNISAGGALVRSYCELAADQPVELELREGQPVQGAISRVSGSDAGITFSSKIDVVDLLAGEADGRRQRMPRIELQSFAYVRNGAMVRRAKVLNISQGGISAECSCDLGLGAEVTVTLPGLPPQHGVVRWSRSGLHGIAFNSVLGLPALVEWLRTQAASERTISPRATAAIR